MVAGRAAKQSSEAERFYQDGVTLCRAGDFAGARREWERIVAAFTGIDSEARWVELARQGIDRLPAQDGALKRPMGTAALNAALERAKKLRTEGKTAEADAALDALEALYRDDPDAAAIRKMIEKARTP